MNLGVLKDQYSGEAENLKLPLRFNVSATKSCAGDLYGHLKFCDQPEHSAEVDLIIERPGAVSLAVEFKSSENP